LYPKVFKDYYDHFELFEDISNIPTKAFFYGLESGEEVLIEFESGKVIIVELIYLTKANDEGNRTVFFKLNGQTRAVEINDKTVKITKKQHIKATETNHIGAPLPGKLVGLKVKKGDTITIDQPLFVLEAMKMESSVMSPIDGKVKKVHLTEGTMVEQNDMVVELE
jgi:pyruvate carboxylase